MLNINKFLPNKEMLSVGHSKQMKQVDSIQTEIESLAENNSSLNTNSNSKKKQN